MFFFKNLPQSLDLPLMKTEEHMNRKKENFNGKENSKRKSTGEYNRIEYQFEENTF